ncbi:MAG: sigma-70 family RNA polymerase sigma factor [Gammaproteobacteria bacterium]|nr:sigma-70 family RNA polymerase sigma factor [Gammaproteobacteria bacterium]
MQELSKRAQFEEIVLPHLDAAYNLARWLVRHPQDAQDLTQEACERAWRFIESFRGGNARAWLLAIVRNTCFSWLQTQGHKHISIEFNEQLHHSDQLNLASGSRLMAADPAELLLQSIERGLIQRELEAMPLEYREIILLREMEGFSYQEISQIVAIPMGTVMSRLARARRALQQRLLACASQEATA